MLGDRVHHWMALLETGTNGIHHSWHGSSYDSVSRPWMATFQVARAQVARA